MLRSRLESIRLPIDLRACASEPAMLSKELEKQRSAFVWPLRYTKAFLIVKWDLPVPDGLMINKVALFFRAIAG